MNIRYYVYDRYKDEIIRTAEHDYHREGCLAVNDSDTVFVGTIAGNWGFFLVESLSCLWELIGTPKKIVCKSDVPLPQKFGGHTWRIMQILNLLGIEEKDISIISSSEECNLYHPGLSFHHAEVPTYGKRTPLEYLKHLDAIIDGKPAYYFTSNYPKIYDTVRDRCHCELPKYEKIYFSRAKLKQKKEIGEKALERIFASNGFKILYPEKLPPVEQIWYVKNCRVLASVEGTLAHNSLFASEGMQQIILRKQSEIIPRQFMINQAKSIDTTWIDCYAEPFRIFPLSHSKGPFFLKATDNLRHFCDENGYVFVKPSLGGAVLDTFVYTTRCCKAFLEKTLKHLFKVCPINSKSSRLIYRTHLKPTTEKTI